MAWWITLLVYVASSVLMELLRPRPDFDDPDAAGLGDFKFPTVGEGRPIPICWGTCKIPGPMVVWYGDLEVEARKKWVVTGWWGLEGEHITTHYRYWMGMQLVLCGGEIDEIIEVRFDEKVPDGTTYTDQDDRTKVHVDAMKLFGGDDSEGGVFGDLYVYHGTATQDPDEYLEAKIGEELPALRHVSYVVFDHVYLGTSAYIKNVSFTVRRCPNQLGLGDGDHLINGDANPAAMIFDLLVRPKGQNGLGLSSGLIDVDAFRACGATLANEEFGLSMFQDQSATARDVIQEILKHIDGIMYAEPSTGLLTLTLIRHDYDVETLPSLDADSCTVTSFTRPSWGLVKNEIRLHYVNRDWTTLEFSERTVIAQDLAALEVCGGEINTQELNMRGFSNATTASTGCSRALAALAYPLASLTIEADRTAWTFRPGTVFKLTWAPYGITDLVCRVLKTATGNLRDGKILLEVLEDVFAVTWTAYTAPGDSGWIDPAGLPGPLTAQMAIGAPYEAVRWLQPNPDVDRAVLAAARGLDTLLLGFNAIVDDASLEVTAFTPSGELTAAIDETSATIVVDFGPDTDAVATVNDPDYAHGRNVLWISDDTLEEFVAFQIVAQDSEAETVTLTVLARGCVDSAPTAFALGTRVWFLSYGSSLLNIEAGASNPITFQPFNNRGELALGSCDDSTVVSTSPYRSLKVYCPTDVEFNGDPYPEEIIGELTVSWLHRNRLAAWSYSTSGATSEAEDDTEYDILVYGELDTLIHTEVGVTGTSWLYPEAEEIADSAPLGRLNNHLRVIIRTYGDSRAHQALREIEWAFDRDLS